MKPKPMTCRELVELVTDYLDGALSRRDRVRFEGHLHECDGCAAYLEQMKVVRANLGRIREQDVPVHAKQVLLDAFREWKSARA